MAFQVLLLPGDGIGPEVIAPARQALQQVARHCRLELHLDHALIGGAALDASGVPLPAATLEQARRADALLLGAVGGPRWDRVELERRPERGLLQLRSQLALFGNLRPVRMSPHLVAASPLKDAVVRDTDLLIVRELTGGLYFGEPRGVRKLPGGEREGFNSYVYRESEIRRIGLLALDMAAARQGRLCSVDKANVLEVTMLWREVMEELAASRPGLSLEHLYVDNAAMQLVQAPRRFDVIVTGNLFGDVLSDLAAALAGSIGMLPSASLGEGGRGLYEPCHGAAPDLAGQDRANPLAAVLSVALLLRHSLGCPEGAVAVEEAVEQVLAKGLRTEDIHRPGSRQVGTCQMGEAVLEELESVLAGTPPSGKAP